MRFMRSPFAGVLAAASLCIGFSALAQTAATVTVSAGTANPAVAQPTAASKDLATDLAKASLAKQGITNPTRAQLDAERKSITVQRAQGRGWGVIAQSLGLNLGQVVSAANKERHSVERTGHHTNHDGDRGQKSGEHKSGADRSGGSSNAGNSGGHGGSGGNGGGGGGGGGKGGK